MHQVALNHRIKSSCISHITLKMCSNYALENLWTNLWQHFSIIIDKDFRQSLRSLLIPWSFLQNEIDKPQNVLNQLSAYGCLNISNSVESLLFKAFILIANNMHVNFIIFYIFFPNNLLYFLCICGKRWQWRQKVKCR